MAFITTDYSDVKEAPSLLPKGDYEVIIKTAEEHSPYQRRAA